MRLRHLLPPPPPLAEIPSFIQSSSLTSSSKIRVLFYNDWGASWEALEPIAIALLANPAFEVIVLAMPSRVVGARFYDLGASQSLREFAETVQCQVFAKQDLETVCEEICADSYAEVFDYLFQKQIFDFQDLPVQNLICVVGFDERVLDTTEAAYPADSSYFTPSDCQAHYVFFTRPYSQLRPKLWHSKYVASVSKLCYVEYGAYTFELKQNMSAYDKKYLCYYDYLFAPTEFHARVAVLQQYQKTLLNIAVTGCPRFEELIAYANSRFIGSFKTYDVVNPTHKLRVAYMPRWAPQDPHSTFSHYMEPLLNLARSGKISLHFRPHPNFYDHIVNEQKIMTQAQWDRFKSDVQQYGFWDESPSILESFSRADVLVSDTSSMLIYAFLSGKPTIYTQGDFRAELNSWALRVVQGCFIASDVDDLLGILARFCEDYGATFAPKLALRQEVLKQNFYFPEGGSARKIISILLEDMDKTCSKFHNNLKEQQ